MKTKFTLPAESFHYGRLWLTNRKAWISRLLSICAIGALAACAPMQAPNAGSEGSPIAAANCTGTIIVPYGMTEVTDNTLLQQAVQPPGKGGLCEGKVLKVQQPLTVYRVWDASNSNSQFGRWWSFAPPAGPVSTYRADNAICPEWSALNRVTQCHLKVGAEIVVGPGQSAQCKDMSYPQSPVNQVLVPNDTRDPKNPKLSVDDCQADVAWP